MALCNLSLDQLRSLTIPKLSLMRPCGDLQPFRIVTGDVYDFVQASQTFDHVGFNDVSDHVTAAGVHDFVRKNDVNDPVQN